MRVIVIGATQGLGFELARVFLANGHTVAAGILERETPPALAALQKEHGERLLVFPADVRNEKEIAAGAKVCEAFLGKADALINVAGVLLPVDRVCPLHECDIAELRATFEVNTIGAIIVVKYFYPVMARGGALITVTSEGVGVKHAGDWVPCYALSKTAATKIAGIMNVTVSDVGFYAVHPGRMNTEMGRTTAQIEPQESALGLYRLLTEKSLSRTEWYINYKGEPMEA
ncbi:MAG: SDR family NAD(P)-dependent oxidoreductase [Clostridia bacterium]|nr:SDR family NAD(P)-dependent oxidoreductase [Clostridia bacterium]